MRAGRRAARPVATRPPARQERRCRATAREPRTTAPRCRSNQCRSSLCPSNRRPSNRQHPTARRGPRRRGAHRCRNQPVRGSSTLGQPGGQAGDRGVGLRPGGPHGIDQDRLTGIRAGGLQAGDDRVEHVVVGAQDVRERQVDARGPRGTRHRVRHVDPGVEGVGEEQRHDHGRTLPSGRQLVGDRVQVGRGQIQVRRLGRHPGRGRHRGQQGLDPGGHLRVAATVRQTDQRLAGRRLPGTPQSRRGVSAARVGVLLGRRDQRVSR